MMGVGNQHCSLTGLGCVLSLVVFWMKVSMRQKVSVINDASKVMSHGNWHVCSSEQRVLCR